MTNIYSSQDLQFQLFAHLLVFEQMHCVLDLLSIAALLDVCNQNVKRYCNYGTPES